MNLVIAVSSIQHQQIALNSHKITKFEIVNFWKRNFVCKQIKEKAREISNF
jgi:hypothetical protein